MKCPMKLIKLYKNSDDSLCSGTEESFRSTVAKIETDFGNCDLRACMAYNPHTGKCRMLERGGTSAYEY